MRKQYELKELYSRYKNEFKERIKEFKKRKRKKDILKEFIFCLLTPQSKAIECWRAVERIFEGDCLNNKEKLLKCLAGVRFRRKKADYILCNIFPFGQMRKYIQREKDVFKLREYLVKNVKGYGYKEASHFLRNIGKGKELAILDTHILKNLKEYGVIDEIPKDLTKKKYIGIEEKMKRFSKDINIPMEELDLLFWAKETGKIFK